MTTADPVAFVETGRSDLVDLALDLLAVDTSNPPGDTTALADLIEEYLDPLPVDVERHTVDPAKPNLLVTFSGETDDTLLYNGHLDTVPFDRGAWSHAPLGERVDDRIYGRGATDMKGALAAINSVPQSATAEVDIRLTAGIDTSAMLSEIRSCVADCEGIAITDVSWSVGTVEPIDSPIVEAVAATAQTVGGERVYRRSATGGGDAKQLRNAGIATVEFAFGTDTVHAADEYTTVDTLVDNAAVYASLPRAFVDAIGEA